MLIKNEQEFSLIYLHAPVAHKGQYASDKVLVWLSNSIWSPLHAHLFRCWKKSLRKYEAFELLSWALFDSLCNYSHLLWYEYQYHKRCWGKAKSVQRYPHTVFTIQCVKSTKNILKASYSSILNLSPFCFFKTTRMRCLRRPACSVPSNLSSNKAANKLC